MKATPGLHGGVAFPFNFTLPPVGYLVHPPNLRASVYAMLGVGAVLGLLSACILSFVAAGRSRPHRGLIRVQTVLIAVLAALLLLEQVIVILQILAIVGMLVDSGLAKLSLALVGFEETLQFLGKQGSWAISVAVVGLFLAYAARTSQSGLSAMPSATSHTALAAYSALCVLLANLLFSAALRRFASDISDYINAVNPLAGILGQKHIAELTYAYFTGIGCLIVAAFLLWVAEKRRLRMVQPSSRGSRWIRQVGAGMCVFVAVVLTAFTQPLAKENASRIPTDHAFANLTLSIPPALGRLRGEGPDLAYGGDAFRFGPREASRFALPEAKSPTQLYNLLRNRRELRHQLREREEAGFDIEIDPELSPQQVREWLASVYWGDNVERLALLMNDVIRLERPVLGHIEGSKWTAARFEIRGRAYKCAHLRGPKIDLTWPSSATTQSILQRIIQARRAGQTACVTVGDRACPSDEPRRPDCMDRLATPLTVSRASQPSDDLRATRVALGTAEFDVVDVAGTWMIKFFSNGARTLAELRRDLENRHCTVHLTMNAGMFAPSYAPVGLFVTDGSVLHALDEGDGEGNFYLKPNGVFSVNRSSARVDSSFDTPQLYGALRAGMHNEMDVFIGLNATQSGPIVLTAGREHPAFDPQSRHRTIRNAVGVRETNDLGEYTHVLFAISNTPVTFHELAQVFTLFDCANALYLDGHVSRMDFPEFGRTVDNRKLGPMIAVAQCPRE